MIDCLLTILQFFNSGSVFAGDEIVAKDTEAENLWLEVGIPKDRIFFYDEKKNWWSRSGIKANMPIGEPGGPSSEIFYEFTHSSESISSLTVSC